MINKDIVKWCTVEKIPQKSVIIGNNKYGKSYCAILQEEIYAENEWPFCCIDAMGIHYVIRAVYDKVVIIGGSYGDFGLDQIDEILPILMQNGYSFIIDVSKIKIIEAQEYIGELFKYFYEWHRTNRKVRNYFIEECDNFMPQVGGDKICKAIITHCIAKGRMDGMGFTLLSQRFRMIDKTPLSQMDNYIIFNMKFPIDLKVVQNLVGDNLNERIRSLDVGQCIIYDGENHGTYKVNEKKSPHAGETPQFGQEIKKIEIKPLGLKF